MVSKQKLQAVIDKALDDASGDMAKLAKSLRSDKVTAGMLSQNEQYEKVQIARAITSWAAVLFVDMRGSTKRAERLGAAKTFMTMHGLMTALTYVVKESGGTLVGFRGDGLFAVFGLQSSEDQPRTDLEKQDALLAAATCGGTMIESVRDVVNPALSDRGVEGGIEIGVAIDQGEIVVTRVGYGDMFELTAYGNAVNNSAKLCSRASSAIILSTAADEIYPAGPRGTATTSPLATAPAVPAPPLEGVILRIQRRFLVEDMS